MTVWTDDALERARYLDGEGSPAERAARAADLLRDPAARARIDAQGRFLAAVRRGADARPTPSDLLAVRVRQALAADRAAGFPATGGGDAVRGRRRVMAIAATFAAIAVGAGVWAASDRVPTSDAGDRAVRMAAEAYREAVVGLFDAPGTTGGSCDEGVSSPHRFPLVTSGELTVEGCKEDGRAAVAVLRRADGGHAGQGLVVVPSDGKSMATDVGYTRVDDIVVFDVSIGRAKYYLATRWEAVVGTPSCAACHGPLRAEHPDRNPHRFVERQPVRLALSPTPAK